MVTVLFIFLVISAMIVFAAIGPVIGRKLFPTPAKDVNSLTVSVPLGLKSGQKLVVDNEIIEITRVEGHKVFFKSGAAS